MKKYYWGMFFIFLLGGGIVVFSIILPLDSWKKNISKKTQEEIPFVVTPIIYDFGKVLQTVASGKIEILNCSKETILLIDTFSNCSCTIATLPQNEIQSREKILIEFSVDMKGKTGEVNNDFGIIYRKKGSDYSQAIIIPTIATVM
jgi:hypothetical protein